MQTEICIFQRFIMEEKQSKIEKQYYSISEVAEMLGVSASMLRFWEQEIPMLKPHTIRNTKIRQYTQKNIDNLRTVYNLVKVRGLKISAAKKALQNNPEEVSKTSEIIQQLMEVRKELADMRKALTMLS